jgi:hypothetical protein
MNQPVCAGLQPADNETRDAGKLYQAKRLENSSEYTLMKNVPIEFIIRGDYPFEGVRKVALLLTAIRKVVTLSLPKGHFNAPHP